MALLTGIVFAIGLVISGMTNPEKVIGFLDFFGHWDPSLALVLIGAVGIYGTAYHIAKRKEKPLMAAKFSLPTNVKIDRRLIIGSAIFGIGWGIAGLCPGAAFTSLASFQPPVLLFMISLILGFVLFSKVDIYLKNRI